VKKPPPEPEKPEPPPKPNPPPPTTTTTTTTTTSTSTKSTSNSKIEEPQQELQQVLKPDDGPSPPPKVLAPAEKTVSEANEIQAEIESVGPGFQCKEKDMGPRTGKQNYGKLVNW
jgi:hypothetical protein